ncbi:microfibril-associated glycoprotein 4 [Aplysia californica]|uniref:Microfibril-associated glycoprotein 4 n=1 Tax=Aplysia californica TaxID=6500 RepID=A0ABM1A768_APLCA|nr:microfibril-associated glycoprotein 4 [Aplysia californica]
MGPISSPSLFPLLLLLTCLLAQPAHPWYTYHHYPQDRPVYTGSTCEGPGYRDLPVSVQNEHQCLVLEQLQTRVRSDLDLRRKQFTDIGARLKNLESKLSYTLKRLHRRNRDKTGVFPGLKDIPISRDCNELKNAGIQYSGIYPIQIPSGAIVNVFCDMETEGGGWTVVQQRANGLVNFTRKWDDYTFGFGNVNNEYWLGNENLHSMTTETRYSLRVDMWDWDDRFAYAQYNIFHVGPETTGYRLTVEGYREESTAGDSLKHHSGMGFSTIDRDNDNWSGSCARADRSGWWFNKCSFCSPNGEFQRGGYGSKFGDGKRTGITWYEWSKRPGYSLMRVQMKIKSYAAVIAHEEIEKTPNDGEDSVIFH